MISLQRSVSMLASADRVRARVGVGVRVVSLQRFNGSERTQPRVRQRCDGVTYPTLPLAAQISCTFRATSFSYI